MGANGRFMRTELGAPGYVSGISQAENRQIMDKFDPVYLGKYRY